jgi:hypothetical protein
MGVALSSLDHFIVEPWRRRSLATFFHRMTMVLHERTNGKFDLLYCRLASLLRPPQKLKPSSWLSESQIDETVAALKKDGCHVLPVKLPPEDIREVTDFVFSTPAYNKQIDEQIPIRRDSIPAGHGRYMWPMQSLLQLKTVQRLIKDSALHRIAESYLGAQCIVTSITLWIDPPYKGEFDPHIYHYDNDGPGFLKYFIYINDVEPDTGAHRFIRGTHHHVKPTPFRLSQRYEEKKLLEYFGKEKEIVFAAPAGTIIAEDTAGFHRGSTVKRNYRLLMQIQHSLINCPLSEEFVKKLEPLPLKGMDPRQSGATRKFFYAA